ncbi:unnamed protein product [Oppiella nova]|uniref:Uncharacterized protein n=1 Tax=Oppiella nova TaxID=334625 RepID=A0A7R9MQ94_9ACAR|nr:unnamed protein product [Oppiella nova]CAG2181690.1 unnamed protein product [Oppiella nova]
MDLESQESTAMSESVEPDGPVVYDCETIGFQVCQLYPLVDSCPESYFCHNTSLVEDSDKGLCRRVKDSCISEGSECCHDIDCCIENEATAPLNCVDQICRVLLI